MNYIRPLLRLKGGWFLVIATVIAATPVLAQTANFGKFELSPGFKPSEGKVEGYTGGSFSLSAISNRDRNKNLCLGYGDPTPDHIMVLKKGFPNLRLQVRSKGADTTLVVQGPNDNTIRCGDDTGKSKDATIQDKSWEAGTYRIWVGISPAGQRTGYDLSVQE